MRRIAAPASYPGRWGDSLGALVTAYPTTLPRMEAQRIVTVVVLRLVPVVGILLWGRRR